MFGDATLSLYKMENGNAVKKGEVKAYEGVEAYLRLSTGGVYVLSDLTEEEILANAQAPETIFTAEDLKNNKQAILDSLANTEEPVVCIMFTAADKAAVMPADVIEAAQANGKQLAAALQHLYVAFQCLWTDDTAKGHGCKAVRFVYRCKRGCRDAGAAGPGGQGSTHRSCA